ncbi:MAG TPA: VWA domain-containing protein [Pyrinomonadaceae bacterium]
MTTRRLYRPRLAAALTAALCLLAHARAQNPPAQQQPQQPQQPPAAARPQDGAPAPPAAAAAAEDEVVRISTELVQTDVMVFDGSGKFVDGLRPEQCALRVDGSPQQVAFFERIKAGAVNEDAQIAAARGRGPSSPGAAGGALPLDRGRTVVFFVDDLHLSTSSAMRIRKTLLRFIDEELGQNDEAAVVSASGQVGFLSQMTDHKGVLRAAAERINPRPSSARDGQHPLMTEVHAASIERGDQQVTDFFVDQMIRENPLMTRPVAESMVTMRARVIMQQTRAVAASTFYSLESAVRGFAPLPGRKVIFFISDGFIMPDTDSHLRERVRILSDAAARAGVVIYSLDAQGLRTGQPDISERVNFDPAGRLQRADLSEISAMQAPLYQLAAETGGRALVNTNALNGAVAGALKETSLYYLLAWRPEAQRQEGRPPRFQRIEVGVAGRPDLRVIVRRGFFSGAPPEPEPRAEKNRREPGKESGKESGKKGAAAGADAKATPAQRALVEALRAPLPRAALPTSMSLGFVYGQNGSSVLTVSVELDREALTYDRAAGKPRADFEVLGAVVDDHGKTVSQFGQRLGVTPSPDTPASEQHVVYSFSLPLPPGLYQVRAAARDDRSGRTGSAMQWVELPELKKQFTMSSLFVGERTARQAGQPERPEDLPHSVLLSVDRRFARTSHIRFLTYVYNPALAAAQPDVALQIQIFRDDQPVFTAPLIKLKPDAASANTQLPYMAELSLDTFQPGSYVLQITAIDRAAKTSASRRARFFIE